MMKVKTRNFHLHGDLDQLATIGQACKQSASGYAPVGKCMSSLVGIKSINNTNTVFNTVLTMQPMLWQRPA